MGITGAKIEFEKGLDANTTTKVLKTLEKLPNIGVSVLDKANGDIGILTLSLEEEKFLSLKPKVRVGYDLSGAYAGNKFGINYITNPEGYVSIKIPRAEKVGLIGEVRLMS